jgi:hypothetical protein
MATNLIGKSRDEIEAALRTKTRGELVDLIHSLVAFEPHFSPSTVARRREISKDTVIELCKNGTIPRVHKPIKNSWRIPLSSIREWDVQTAIRFNGNS